MLPTSWDSFLIAAKASTQMWIHHKFASDGTGSHIRMLWSSEHDANMYSFIGFQATALTLPSPWPANTFRRTLVPRCHTYTFPSYQKTWTLKTIHDRRQSNVLFSPSLPLTMKLSSIPPKQLRMMWRPWLWPKYLHAILPAWISQK